MKCSRAEGHDNGHITYAIIGDFPYGPVKRAYAPFVYTPGDNEWTDCHVAFKNNGLYTPTERLVAVRNVFFPQVGRTLGIHSAEVTSQGLVDPANA